MAATAGERDRQNTCSPLPAAEKLPEHQASEMIVWRSKCVWVRLLLYSSFESPATRLPMPSTTEGSARFMIATTCDNHSLHIRGFEEDAEAARTEEHWASLQEFLSL